MQATDKNTARAIAFARTASAPGATDAERATATDMLTAFCIKHGLVIADIIARASQADPTPAQARRDAAQAAKRASAPEQPAPKPEQPKAAKPSKPSADDSKRAADYAERVALVAKLRASVAALYNGPSLAVRSNPKRIAASVYSDLLASPKHRTDIARISARDESALREIILRGDASAAFDPVALNLDSGIFSRLASVGFIETAPASAKLPYRLTKPGAEHARKAFARAA